LKKDNYEYQNSKREELAEQAEIFNSDLSYGMD
jgi:hypothetical protein